MNKQGDNSIEVNLFLKDKLPSRPLVFERGKNVYFISLPATVYNGPRKIDVAAFKDEISNVTIDFVPYKTSKNSGYTRIIIETKNKTKITIKDTAGTDAKTIALILFKIFAVLSAVGLFSIGGFYAYKKLIAKKNLAHLLDVDEIEIENAQSEQDIDVSNNQILINEDAELLNYIDAAENVDDLSNEIVELSDFRENIPTKDIIEQDEISDATENPSSSDLFPSADEIVNDILNNDDAIEEIANSVGEEILSDELLIEQIDENEHLAEVEMEETPEQIDETEHLAEVEMEETPEQIDENEHLAEVEIEETPEQIDENEHLAEVEVEETPEQIDENEHLAEVETEESLLAEDIFYQDDISLFEENDIVKDTDEQVHSDLEYENISEEDLLDTFSEHEDFFVNENEEENSSMDVLENASVDENLFNPFDSFVADIPTENEIAFNKQSDIDTQTVDEDLSDDAIFDELIQEAQDDIDVLQEEFASDNEQEFIENQLEDELVVSIKEQADDIAQDLSCQTEDFSEKNPVEIENSSTGAIVLNEGFVDDATVQNAGNVEQSAVEEITIDLFEDKDEAVVQKENVTDIQLDTTAFFKEETEEVSYFDEDVFYKDEEGYNFASEVVEPEEFFKDDAPKIIDDSEPLLVSAELIDTDKNIYLVRHNGEYSLIGMIGENVFVLNKFSHTPTKDKIHIKLNETKDGQNIYIVKVDSWRALIAIDENGMENILTLS